MISSATLPPLLFQAVGEVYDEGDAGNENGNVHARKSTV